MTIGYLLVAAILFSCILADRFSGKFGMPALILFMAVGMIFGSDGIFKIQFNNYDFAEKVCSAALIFIMFYGGFNTKWKTAKSVAARAILLSTAGVVVTAGLTAVFCHFVLHFNFVESFLIGAVLSSTDAASVFSILRGKNLNLKDGTAPLLEIESGSNDPMSYLLTVIGISMLGVQEMGSITWMVFSQIVFGILVGILTAVLGIFLMTKVRFVPEGQETIFVIAIVIFAFGFAELIGGNSYLSVYLLGILLGNSPVRHKDVMIPFFDGVTGLAQIMIFFLLGLLAFPHKMPAILPAAILIALFLTFIARPIAVFGIL
ncbi:MAG: potassium/proton antiporter, partial [Lachnospiraceae bacterium]